jgi:hypothetical protein
MKQIYFIMSFFLVVAVVANAQIYNEESTSDKDTLQSPPMIEIKPCVFHVKADESGFITKQVKVLNRGGKPLMISKVTGSCGCSKASVQSGLIHPLSVGKIILYINLDGLYDDNRMVEYVIESNAKNSPTSIKVFVEEPFKDNKDKK